MTMRRGELEKASGPLARLLTPLVSTPIFDGGLAHGLLRAVLALEFYSFGIQKWNAYTAKMLVPLISHSPVVFWLEPAFGVRGAGFFLGASELTFGTLILLGFWSRLCGVAGALGSSVTFIGTVSIVPFLPGGWAQEAGGFPIMELPLAFLWKDLLFLAVSLFLLRRDLVRLSGAGGAQHP